MVPKILRLKNRGKIMKLKKNDGKNSTTKKKSIVKKISKNASIFRNTGLNPLAKIKFKESGFFCY